MSAVTKTTLDPNVASIAARVRDYVDGIGDKANAAKPGSARSVICRYVADLTNSQRTESPFLSSGKSLKSRTAENVTKLFNLRNDVECVVQDLIAELGEIEEENPETRVLVAKERGVILDALEDLHNGNLEDCLEPVADIFGAVEKMFGKTKTTAGASILKKVQAKMKECVKKVRNKLADLADKIAKTFSKISTFLRKPIPIIERGLPSEDRDVAKENSAEWIVAADSEKP
jgi:ElaB/YqjD/DUF883 family membrane-anchored ribosome-binding protein